MLFIDGRIGVEKLEIGGSVVGLNDANKWAGRCLIRRNYGGKSCEINKEMCFLLSSDSSHPEFLRKASDPS